MVKVIHYLLNAIKLGFIPKGGTTNPRGNLKTVCPKIVKNWIKVFWRPYGTIEVWNGQHSSVDIARGLVDVEDCR